MAYGKIIPDLKIDGTPAPYGVVNEREIRAAAGIMFAVGLFTLLTLYHTKEIWLAFWVVLAFWVDFLLKVGIGPEWSYIGRLAAWVVRGQRPEYVGAIQKRFAWSIGLVLSSLVLFLVARIAWSGTCPVGLTLSFSSCLLPMMLCSICLVFMWLESAAGICVGCSIYTWLVKKGIIDRPEYAPACPGGACSITHKSKLS